MMEYKICEWKIADLTTKPPGMAFSAYKLKGSAASLQVFQFELFPTKSRPVTILQIKKPGKLHTTVYCLKAQIWMEMQRAAKKGLSIKCFFLAYLETLKYSFVCCSTSVITLPLQQFVYPTCKLHQFTLTLQTVAFTETSSLN